jgi:hypothetical protein
MIDEAWCRIHDALNDDTGMEKMRCNAVGSLVPGC